MCAWGCVTYNTTRLLFLGWCKFFHRLFCGCEACQVLLVSKEIDFQFHYLSCFLSFFSEQIIMFCFSLLIDKSYFTSVIYAKSVLIRWSLDIYNAQSLQPVDKHIIWPCYFIAYFRLSSSTQVELGSLVNSTFNISRPIIYENRASLPLFGEY